MSPLKLRFPLCALVLILPLCSSAATGEPESPSPQVRADQIPRIDPEVLGKLDKLRMAKRYKHRVANRISRYMVKAADAIDAGDYAEGHAILDRLNPKRLNPHERARMYRVKAYIDYSAGDVASAIESFQKVIDQEVLALKDDNEIRFNVAQLHAGQQQWPELIAAIHGWIPWSHEPSPLAHYLLAIAHYHLEQTDLALANAETTVDLAPEPKEAWLQLLAALYVKQEDYANAAPVLEELVMQFPKKQYWVQLSLIYGARDNFRHSLAVQQIAYTQGFLSKDSEVRRLARSYLYHELPEPAARVLERGIEEGTIEPDADAFELFANSLVAAREYERSLAPLARAADLSDDGDLYVRLAQVRMQREEWAQAVEMLEKAIAKGDLKKPGNAQLLLGVSYYNDEHVGQARSSFARARKHDDTRTQADQWISHIEHESGAG